MTTTSFSSGWDFVMVLGKPHLPANLEVANFSRCRNIKENPKFWEAPLAQGHAHFSLGFIMGLGKLKLHTIFEVAGFSPYRNIKGEPQILGAPLAHSHAHFFL